MARELAFVLINPYTIAKSRTGGVIARYMGRTDLDFVGARMFGPSMDLVGKYSELVRHAESDHQETCSLIADYILNSYAPDHSTGKPQRVMMLLFEGDDAVARIWKVTGSATLRWGSGETIRDTYGDYVVDSQERVQYFEPAVLVAPTRKRAAATLDLWAKYTNSDGGIIDSASDVPRGERVEKTLVLLKPDNFQSHSSRPGNIIDILSSSGLRIVAIKKFKMTVSQAERFYGPVRETLKKKFRDIALNRAADALAREFGFEVPQEAVDSLCSHLGPLFADGEFENIVHFMTGYRPSKCTESEKNVLGREECFALVYEGVDAVSKIRTILGPTDPNKAKPGSVRREYGSNIMINAAHASDSPKNSVREMEIINLEEDTIKALIDKYYGDMLLRISVMGSLVPKIRHGFMRKLRNLWKGKSGNDEN
ncbi:nucleoside-diphosphate kinase [Verrucomicrobiota bacterium]